MRSRGERRLGALRRHPLRHRRPRRHHRSGGQFYRRAFADEVLGPIFLDVARVDLSAHLLVMGGFWDTVLLRAGLYHRNALRPHLALAAEVELTDAHFTRWLALWTATVEERHAGPRAELAKTQAARIAGSIHRRVSGEHASIQLRHPDQEPS